MHEIQFLKYNQIPFFRILLFFSSGILTAFSIPWTYSGFLILIFSIILLLLLSSLSYLTNKRSLLNLLLFPSLFCLGMLSMVSKFSWDKPVLDKMCQCTARLLENPIRNGEILRAKIEILHINHLSNKKQLSISAMANIWDKDSTIISVKKGDFLQFHAKIQPLKPAYNPNQFDYSQYLKTKAVNYQVFIPINHLIIHNNKKKNLLENWLLDLQLILQKKFKKFIHDQAAFQIGSAISFGYRSEISDDIMEVFSNTGTIHVLSVSGFHVSMMFWFLTLILKPSDFLFKNRNFRLGFIFCFIWFYAMICGFVPAVLRATVMFSLFLIGYWRYQVPVSLNAVFSSAFLLLLYDSYMLFDIGFLLSYLAVIGILVFQPILKGLVYTKHKIANTLLDLVYVSLSAQITTTALAIYYFQQFPTSFLISNILITFPSTLILIIAALLAISPFEHLNIFFGQCLSLCIKGTFEFLKLVDAIPFSSIKGIPLNSTLTWMAYLSILLFLFAIRFKRKVMIYLSLIFSIFTMASSLLLRMENKSFKGIKFYNTRKDFSFAIIQSGSVHLISSCDSINHKTLKFNIWPDLKNYSELKNIHFTNLKPDKVNQYIQLMDSVDLFIQNSQTSHPSKSKILLLRKNATLARDIKADFILIDGSNSSQYIHRIKERLDLENRPYYILKDNFAYVWNSE